MKVLKADTTWYPLLYILKGGVSISDVNVQINEQIRDKEVRVIGEDGELRLIYDNTKLPYSCPLIESRAELSESFVRATATVWKHLIRDPLIYDLVKMNSLNS